MVRWRLCLVLAMLLLLPAKIGSKMDDEDDEERSEESDEDSEDDDEENEEDVEKPAMLSRETSSGRRAPVSLTSFAAVGVTRTTKKRPLECYVCAYKSETPLRACLDPTKFRVHTITCHSVDDRCFTSVISKGESYDAVVRGCRSGCVGSSETTCCELNRCNNQAFAVPLVQPRALATSEDSKASKCGPNVLFFVTILLVLQTVVKVAFV